MNMRNMNQMMRQVKKMQEQMMKAQEELANKTVEGSAGGGVVTVSMNGHKKVLGITINPEAVDPDDVEMLQDLGDGSVNDALAKADELVIRIRPLHRRLESARIILRLNRVQASNFGTRYIAQISRVRLVALYSGQPLFFVLGVIS